MKKTTYLIIGSLCLLYSCSHQDNLAELSNFEDNNFSKDQNTNFISTSQIEDIANDIFVTNNTVFSKGGEKKDIRDIKPIGSDENLPSYYVINYEDGGFLIMSSDKRALPVLAFSEEHNFNLDTNTFPGSLVDWLKSQDEYILKVRDGVADGSIITVGEELWEIANIENYISSKTNDKNKTIASKSSCSGPTVTLQYGPLTSTTWGQLDGYNNSAPDYDCTNTDNGRTPTGCVATAMAQIMKYHEHPSSYNWSIMPDGKGSDETSRLMKDAGDSVNMNWGCKASGALTSDTPSAFKNTFGYSSAEYTEFNDSTLESELAAGFPVILRGGEKTTTWLFFTAYENGHAWVCDGIRRVSAPAQINMGRAGLQTVCVQSWSYYMNWGWGGKDNGWYSYGNWQVDGYSFDDENEMVYNIRK